MIDIALSNKNHQKIQEYLETCYPELVDFVADGDSEHLVARKLVNLMLMEHNNIKNSEVE